MTHVHLISTGGTIVSRDSGAGARAEISVGTLLADIDVEIETSTEDLANVNSFRLTLRQLAELARAVERACEDDSVAGVVITHGTDTMEESAFLLELVHRHPQPVILTGAQKSADQRDTDGPQNLTDALVSAAHRGCVRPGSRSASPAPCNRRAGYGKHTRWILLLLRAAPP